MYHFEITLEKAINLLKTILPGHAFFGRGPQVGPIVFLTDDSRVEHNALEMCWPQGVYIYFLKSNKNSLIKISELFIID